ncbi:MAG: hypothetical protein IJX64_05855 [Clostridia bacterium]|nr:hypothetical protein [Clostridia bacterium]
MVILFAIFIGIISHFYGQALPRKWFHGDKFPYKSFRWEQEGRIYRHIGIHKWQEKLPDLSRTANEIRIEKAPSSCVVNLALLIWGHCRARRPLRAA